MNKIVELQRLRDERNALEARLFQAQKMEVVGQLAGGVAHDFNNLLAIVVGQLDVIEGKMADHADLQEQVSACKRAVEQTAVITRGMLAFLRDQSLKPLVFKMDDAVNDLLHLIRHSLGRTIAISIDHGRGLWTCEADPAQMQNALLNLTINARDAMPQGGRITVMTRNARLDKRQAAALRDVRPGDYVVLSVKDTGSGMPPEVMERATEPFFTTKPVGKGSGLGLSMVRGFATRSGGHLQIESTQGKGTTVSIYLPRGFGAVQEQPDIVPHTEIVAAGAANKPMVVVDDDPDMREMLVSQLRKSGYTALPARSAAEALAILDERADIAVMFLDVVLPGDRDVDRLTERLSRDLHHVKVVHMSGYPRQTAIGHGRLAPDTPVLEKPFGREALLSAIRQARGLGTPISQV